MKCYEGKRSGNAVVVKVDGIPLNPRFDLCIHSPDGFEWGYGGNGPAQLALALLADCLEDGQQAVELCDVFKLEVVARLPESGWQLTSLDVGEALQRLTRSRYAIKE